MGFIYDNLNNNSNFATASTKHVTFGKVETYEYTKVEPKASVKKKIQGFIDNALTIGNDENLKILIKNQPFWILTKANWKECHKKKVFKFTIQYYVISINYCINIFYSKNFEHYDMTIRVGFPSDKLEIMDCDKWLFWGLVYSIMLSHYLKNHIGQFCIDAISEQPLKQNMDNGRRFGVPKIWWIILLLLE